MNRPNNLGSLFDRVAGANADNPAIAFTDQSVSYQDLNFFSNQVANFLLSEGVQARDVVCILNTKTLLGYASMLACLKIGAIYANLDETNPPNRLAKIFSTCRPKILICDHVEGASIVGAANQDEIPVVGESDLNVITEMPGSPPELATPVTGSNPAYIMFTSGSTGTPKGVLISHDNLLSFISWSVSRFSITPADKFAQISPLYFDNSVFDFYTAFFSGATIVPVSREVTKDPVRLIDLIDSQQCTIWFSVPSMLVYLQTLRLLHDGNLTSIRNFIFGGEGYPKRELKNLYNRYSSRALLTNVYGPTEGTCICSAHDITAADVNDLSTLAPLGPINENFDYAILNEHLVPVEPGEKGELCIAGPNIARGYYADPDRTATSFIQNPFVSAYSETVYRTGDLVYEKNGKLWFAGRVDNQIKHMGYRIELEEIESALNGLPAVIQSAVIYKRENERYGKIIAFVSVVARDDEQHLKAALAEHLPSYMIPSVIIIKKTLPKNQNGKVDRKLLSNEYASS